MIYYKVTPGGSPGSLGSIRVVVLSVSNLNGLTVVDGILVWPIVAGVLKSLFGRFDKDPLGVSLRKL